jgi:hypothetical protein
VGSGTPPPGGGGLLPIPGGGLIISPGGVSAIPEAETWMMMVIGFGALGFMLRRRRKGLAHEASGSSLASDHG